MCRGEFVGCRALNIIIFTMHSLNVVPCFFFLYLRLAHGRGALGGFAALINYLARLTAADAPLVFQFTMQIVVMYSFVFTNLIVVVFLFS